MDTSTSLDLVLELGSVLAADQERFQAAEGLTGPRVHLVWVLGASGGAAPQRALAEALGVSPRNVTGLVDGLSASGHVTREPQSGDRRVRLVTLTALGIEVAERLRREHAALAEALFGDVPASDLRTFTDTLTSVLDRLRTLVEEARP